jgi:hypothetical protein
MGTVLTRMPRERHHGCVKRRVRLSLDPEVLRLAAAELGTHEPRDTIEAALRTVADRGRRRWLAQRDFSDLDALLPEIRRPR